MKKVSIISAEEAALKVQDGDTIATGGFVSCACPETLTKALEKRFLETGHPKDLTLFFAAGQGHRDGTGGDHYGHEGMVKRVIGGHWDRAPRLGELALNNKIEAYNLPQGVISHMYRDIAAHNIGTSTHVGQKTFADPCNVGGKLIAGTENILPMTEFDERCSDADVVITGEGRTDFQTADGKLPVACAAVAKKHGLPVVCVCGSASPVDALYEAGIDAIFSVQTGPMSIADSIASAAQLIENTCKNLAGFADAIINKHELNHQ